MINEYTKFDVTNDNRQTLPRFQPEAIRANYRIVEVLNAFGRTRGITPAQIALAWLMNKKPFIVPIPGTTKLSHLEENLRACDIRFTAEEIEELETAVAAIPVVGSRYDALQESKIPNNPCMKKQIFYMTFIALLSGCNCYKGNILQIEEQGSFAVGGTVLTDSLGHKYHGDHAYVFYQKPVDARKYPLVLHMVSASFPKHGRPLLTDAKGFRIYFFAKVSPPILSTSLAGEMPDGVRKLSHWNRYSMKKNGSTVSVWESILIISRVYSSVATGKP